jgi:predicted RNA-binding Zn-ribbon protein involved in translation (DUF1610 family)
MLGCMAASVAVTLVAIPFMVAEGMARLWFVKTQIAARFSLCQGCGHDVRRGSGGIPEWLPCPACGRVVDVSLTRTQVNRFARHPTHPKGPALFFLRAYAPVPMWMRRTSWALGMSGLPLLPLLFLFRGSGGTPFSAVTMFFFVLPLMGVAMMFLCWEGHRGFIRTQTAADYSLCMNCGYDTRGLDSPKTNGPLRCPECGEEVNDARTRRVVLRAARTGPFRNRR